MNDTTIPRLKIAAKDFLAYWKQIKTPPEELKEHVLFCLNGEELLVENVEIEGNINVYGYKLVDVSFINSHMRGYFSIRFSHVGNISIFGNSHVGNIDISANCNVKNIYISRSSKAERIYIENSHVGDICVGGKSKIRYVMISKNSEAGSTQVLKDSEIGYLTVSIDSEIGDIQVLEGSKIESIQVYGNLQTGGIRISENSQAGSIQVFGKFAGRGIQVSKNSKVGSILASNNTNLSEIEVRNSKVKEIIMGYLHINKIIADNDSIVEYIKCYSLSTTNTQLVFRDSLLAHLDLEGVTFSEDATLSISNCRANQITFKNTYNYGRIYIGGLRAVETWDSLMKDEHGNYLIEEQSRPSNFRLIDSDLGNTQFIGCNLSTFKRFEFFNSKMLDVFFADTKLPQESNFYQEPLPTDTPTTAAEKKAEQAKINRQKRLAYGQFKKIYENQGDRVSSLHNLVSEMEAYRKQLLADGGWCKNFGELFMICMNKTSTNYGTDWERGVCVTLIALVFFYSIFLWLVGYRLDLSCDTCCTEFWKVWSYAPYYLNPLRDNDSIFVVEEKDINTCARVWDFFSRIFLTYFVYQLIQAFRKLGKSGE